MCLKEIDECLKLSEASQRLRTEGRVLRRGELIAAIHDGTAAALRRGGRWHVALSTARQFAVTDPHP